ncbi:hypothetical protein F503_07355 [Ophiostoma piceae UAMH 11346]|uniref:NACHT domain-containing protein n=1 Tax=Ophiostoma piceae (strain UAMH 11346) TaxID=1262450 RepID=S3C7S9_OPHP1|nr:hypothetical protein F503_07355 [Ophiostoma piceae UAMH 11346]
MVPLDGFSLACNIFQAIGFTRDVFKQVKEIVEQGKGDYDEDFISSKADRLTAFCSEIDDKTKAITRSGLLRNARPASVAYGSAFALPITFGAALPSALPSASDHKSYAELLEVADQCRTATKEFQDVIASLDLSSGKGDVPKAFKVWAKTAWNRRKTSKLEKCMQEYEKLLDSVILKELLTKTNAIALQQRSDFAQLDSQLQKLIGLVLDDPMNIKVMVDELNTAITTRIDNVALEVKITVANDGQATRDHMTTLDSSTAVRIGISTSAVTSAVSHEAVSTRGHFDARFRQAERRQRDERSLDQELRSFDKLLHSVQSNEANIRQAEVSDAHVTTYEWVFDPGKLKNPRFSYNPFRPEDGFRDNSRTAKGKGKDEDEDTSETHLCNKYTDSKMDCFVCWLSGPQAKPYWVCGKPGSGKSTLMKYIARSPRTRSTLEKIYGLDAMILSHFIYLYGQKEQRSRRGILLSLTHQYLSRISGDAAKIQLVQTVSGALKYQVPDIILKETSSEWSYGDLEKLLLALLEDSQRKVVIFIDGLDEVEVERQEASPSPVLSLIDKLCRLPQAHVCISSRPEKVFHDKFADGIHLRLQDLTRHDISKYVTDHLQQFYTEDESRRKFLGKLVFSVWNQSDGVFLWACIVAKNLAEALSNGDDDWMVEERLKELPRDINDLYQAMLTLPVRLGAVGM